MLVFHGFSWGPLGMVVVLLKFLIESRHTDEACLVILSLCGATRLMVSIFVVRAPATDLVIGVFDKSMTLRTVKKKRNKAKPT
jgi:hypothetical protein